MPGTEIEAQEEELQPRGASMRTRWPPTENEIVPASADELATINTTSAQSRFIGVSPSDDENLTGTGRLECDSNHPAWENRLAVTNVTEAPCDRA